jgi:hypothetical protein
VTPPRVLAFYPPRTALRNVRGDGLYVERGSGEPAMASRSATAWFSRQTTFEDGSQLCICALVGVVEYPAVTCVTICA